MPEAETPPEIVAARAQGEVCASRLPDSSTYACCEEVTSLAKATVCPHYLLFPWGLGEKVGGNTWPIYPCYTSITRM